MLAAGLGLVMGLVIGALGGGGGVLAVPALVYLLGQSAQDATSSSVLIVGVTAAAGVLARIRGGLIRWRTGLTFGALGVPAAALGTLLNQRVAEPVLLLAFAALTLLVAAVMLLDGGGGHPPHDAPDPPRRRAATILKVLVCGLVIGFLTGFLGVGGGFLVIPALVIVLRMRMTLAIGTSLLIIAINAGAALGTRAGVTEFDWAVVVPFTAAAVVASLAGKRIADRFSGAALSRAFALMLLAVGAAVAVQSIVSL